MRRRIVEARDGAEAGDARLGGPAAHLLRLVQDDDGVVGGDYVDGATTRELVALGVHDAGLLGAPALLHGRIERLHVDDHDVDIGTRREPVDVAQTSAVVDKVADGLAVLLKKVLLGILERLVDALADGDGRHHDDELGPAVEAVELEHGLGIDVSLARARLHLHIEIYRSGANGKRRRLNDSIAALYPMNVLEQRGGSKGDGGIRVALGRLDLRLKARQRLGAISAHRVAEIAQIERGARVRLAGEDIGHRTRSLSLIRLDFKLELHPDLLDHLTDGIGAKGFK